MMTWTLKRPNPTYITHNSCRRPVTEKGRTAARPSVSFSRPFSSPPVRRRRNRNLFLSASRVDLPAFLPCICTQRLAMMPLRYPSSPLNGRWKSETPLQMMKEGRQDCGKRERERKSAPPLVLFRQLLRNDCKNSRNP